MNVQLLHLAPCAVLIATSCSLRISHPDGSVTHLGAVNIREASAGQLPLVHTRRFGLLMDAGFTQNALALGYDDRLILIPTDDAISRLNYTYGSDPNLTITPVSRRPSEP